MVYGNRMNRRGFMGAVGAGAAGLAGAAMMGSSVAIGKGFAHRGQKPVPPGILGNKKKLYTGVTLKEIRTRGYLRTGFPKTWVGPGFNSGPPNYEGYSMDYVRFFTIAAFSGVVPDIESRVDDYFKVLDLKDGDARGTALQQSLVDVMDAQVTMTLTREAYWGTFAETTIHDGASLMWNPVYTSPVTTLADLVRGQKVGYESTTTAEIYVPAKLVPLGLIPVAYSDLYDAVPDLASGDIDFMTIDETYLRQIRADSSNQTNNFKIAAHGPLGLSEEPLTTMTRGDDENWTSIVKWCIYATFAAYELGITQANIMGVYNYDPNANPPLFPPIPPEYIPEAQVLLGKEKAGEYYLAEKLGLDRHAFRNAIRAIGAWHEIWDNNMLEYLDLARGGANEIPKNGGLFNSPVFG